MIVIMSSDNTYAQRLLAARGRRAAATILSYLERSLKVHLSEDEWQRTRMKVLETVAEFQDFAIDMIKAEDGVINEYWADALDRIHNELKGLRAERQESSV